MVVLLSAPLLKGEKFATVSRKVDSLHKPSQVEQDRATAPRDMPGVDWISKCRGPGVDCPTLTH